MSDYGYRIKDGQVRLVTGDDLVDLQVPTKEQLAAYKAAVKERMPVLDWYPWSPVQEGSSSPTRPLLSRNRHPPTWQ
jgi:hypothetical protein